MNGLEYIINKILQLDPQTSKLLEPLNKKAFAFHIDNINKTFYALFTENKISILTEKPEYIDTTIKGSWQTFIAMAINQDVDRSLQAQLDITGDLASAESLQYFIHTIEIDWEEELAKITGDAVAHKVGLISNSAYNNFLHTSNSMVEMLAEYLQHEAQLLPTKHEINTFISQVDELRLATERLEAKIKLLTNLDHQ